MSTTKRTKAQQATHAIQLLYINMLHLFNRGYFRPMGMSGTALREALLELEPEIYGSMGDDKLELNGLIYVMDRLPQGIEECRIINLTADEGHGMSNLKPIIPAKRRRLCYRIDSEQMNIEITRGRSDIFDVLTHLTFLSIESHKIAKRILVDNQGNLSYEWQKFEQIITKNKITESELEIAVFHVGNIIGRTFEEIVEAQQSLASKEAPYRLLHIIYWLGKLAIEEINTDNKRIILFSPILRTRTGRHFHGEKWAENLKERLVKEDLLKRPLHIVSANMHSVMTYLFGKQAFANEKEQLSKYELFERLSQPENEKDRKKVSDFALKEGMIFIQDTSGANINVQFFDLSKIDLSKSYLGKEFTRNDVIMVMDYAFGEQAFEVMDEFLRPYEKDDKKMKMNIKSISIMGKAGILDGNKGDIMIPHAHIYEGTADNYPFKNELSAKDFENDGVHAIDGNMVTVLGTSLQNKDVLTYFKKSTWNIVGIEMEGAHYQKAIQAASKIRKGISPNVKLRYAYYASDNPLETGSTLASGGLGLTGVKPTYLITEKFLEQIVE